LQFSIVVQWQLILSPVTLTNTETFLVTDTDGQFLVSAESYTFQVGKNNAGHSIQITEDNIKNLINALEDAAA
jgi:phosphatidate phosphatase APP1